MEERKQRVLQAIIDDYIVTAEPVGSRTIARKYNLGVSPATIRNEMADLEEQGYLEQPHTSAGRVPSDKGYRYYVNFLIEGRRPAEVDGQRIREMLARKAREIEDLIHWATRILSEATDCLAVATNLLEEEAILQSIQLIPFRDDRVLLLLVSEDGLVQHKVVETGHLVTVEELGPVSRFLSQRLRGMSFGDIGGHGIRELQTELGRYRFLVEHIVEFLADRSHEARERVIVGGTTNILKQPEFRDVEKAYTVLRALEQEGLVHDLLYGPWEGEGVAVAIGEEIRLEPMQDCSLVLADYTIGGRPAGRMGVLGPRRMDYARVMATVDAVTRSISDILTDSIG